MFSNAFVKVDPEESAKLLAEINPYFGAGAFNENTATVLGQELSFYPGYYFLDIADYSITPAPRKFVIYKRGDVTVLNWTNDPLYRLNERVPVKINEDTVADYVRFFFTYIRGRHGRFIIVESVDDISWSEEPPLAARKAIGQRIFPVEVKSTSRDGTTHLTASMVFKDSLFRTDIHVKAGGAVDLSGEELLIEDMPVLDDTFGQ